MQLFVNSAARASRFSVSDADWAAIARICRLLEGIPLGVEMAAAWVKLISPQEILAEIENNANFLEAKWRNIPERQHTLQAVFEIFLESAQLAGKGGVTTAGGVPGWFSARSRRPGGWRIIIYVSSSGGQVLPAPDRLGAFRNSPGVEALCCRKTCHDPAAQAEASTRHSVYFSDLLSRQVFPRLKGADQAEALAVTRSEAQNLRQAFKKLTEMRDFKRLEEILPAVILFFEMNNQRVETQEVINRLVDLEGVLRQELDQAEGAEPDRLPRSFLQALLGITLAALHHFHFSGYQVPLAAPQQMESLELVKDLSDTEAKAFAILLSCRGSTYLSVDQRLDLLQECYAIFKHLNDAWGAALTRLIWADEINMGDLDLDLARVAYQASLQTFVEVKNIWGKALCINGLAIIEQKNGNVDEAYRLGSQALDLFSQMLNAERVAGLHHSLGEIALVKGSKEDARLHFEANQKYFAVQGDKGRQQYYQERVEGLQ